MQTTILVSRFPDALTEGALPLVEQAETPAPRPARRPIYYSLHVLDTGNVMTCRWEPEGAAGWDQRSPMLAENVALARANVPSEAEHVAEIPADAPVTEAFELWVLR